MRFRVFDAGTMGRVQPAVDLRATIATRPLPTIVTNERTNQRLQRLALPGESSAAVVRRSLQRMGPEQQPPPSRWLARAISPWLAHEGLSKDDDAPHRLADHILNNWAMVRSYADENTVK
jgi:hypothetical protein